MKILNKLMFGLAFSVLTFLTSPVTSYCVTNAEITEVAVGKAGDRFPVEVTTETVTLETVKSSQPVIEVETLERSYISDEDLTLLTPKAMAWWFMDDGTTSGKCSISIATCSFSIDGLLRLKEYLKTTYDIDITIQKDFKIYFPSNSAKKFYELIKDFIIPEMMYKFKYLLI